MSSFANSIDTDGAIGTILSNFSTEYIMNVIEDSLKMKFRPFDNPMPNYVDVLDRNFKGILEAGPDYKDKICDVRDKTYIEIITMICRYYQIDFIGNYDNLNPIELYSVAHTMYDIFISRFTDYMIDFFIRYIIDNSENIYAKLVADGLVKEDAVNKDQVIYRYIDPKMMSIHQNLNRVVYDMCAYDISFETLIQYFTDRQTATFMLTLFEDTGDIFKNFFAIYVTDQYHTADVLTSIKLKLQSMTREVTPIDQIQTRR